MAVKVFIACLGTETNTFSNMPTGHQTFAETMLHHGDATVRDSGLFSVPLKVWRKNTEDRQGQVVESLAAFAQPGGVTVRCVYEGFRDEILGDLRRARSVDVVLLGLHGAMVAEGYDDCEGDLVAEVRAIVGPEVTVGVELDLHCSLTEKILTNADAVVIFKEYPHIDVAERAQELFDICLGAARGETKPVMAVHDLRMVSMWRTPVEPAASIVRTMQEAERTDGVLSVSLAHGFPWGDVPEASAKVLVVADGDGAKARAVAAEVGAKVWELREETHPRGLSIDAALDAAVAAPHGPVVLADIGDNAGGGAPSDSTFVLHRVLERGVENVLNGIYWDPVAVRFCMEAGEGAEFDLRIGGKVGVDSGDPVDLRIRVERIVRDAKQTFGQGRVNMGDSVWVSAAPGAAKNLDLVLSSVRMQTFHPDAFTQFGIDVAAKKIVVVKSTQHFYAGFAPVAKEIIYVAGPGAMSMNFEALNFRKFTDPYWPKVADPFAAA
jgi:microcystin degradation protein MlrC